MSFERSNVKIALITVAVGILICVGIVLYGTHKKGNSVTYDRDAMLDKARKFYEEGDIKKAISQMEYYCLNRDDVFEEEKELAGWYTEIGDDVNAAKTYRLAVSMADYNENEISVNEPFYHVGSDSVRLKIEPVVGFTTNMELIFKGEDITPEGYDIGKVNGIRDELTDDKGCRTTPWTEVDKSKGSVILTGDMNCAVWQFMNAGGEIKNIEDLYYEEADENSTESEGENIICPIGSIELKNRSYSIMEIPEDAVKCRVTYADESIDGRSFSDSKGVLMYYGSMLQGYSDSGASSCSLPDLGGGQTIIYENGKWSLYVNDSYMQDLDIAPPAIYAGAGIFMQGDVCGRVIVEEMGQKETGSIDAEYGIEFMTERGISVGRRLGDAVGMHFDYYRDQEWAGGSGNDFDTAYPWSQMKLCNLTYSAEEGSGVIYQGDAGFAEDGSNGNVMVEIPKFYVKRIQDEGTEQIWISGTEHEGYVLDPVFMDNGEEKDHVYIGAYAGVEEDGILLSKAGAYPCVNIPYDEIRGMARGNGEGYREIGYTLYSALQKLFLVETGCMDSTSLMAGEQDLYYYSQNKDYNNKNTGIALQSVQASNRIVVNDFGATQKFEEGTSVVFLNASEGWASMEKSGGPNGTDETEEISDEEEDDTIIVGGCCREITSVQADGGHIEINFDGDPINIRAGETVIASYPSMTGKTGEIDYCTGIIGTNNGRHGFKYRNIENLYGSEMMMLGADAYLMDGSFYFLDGNGEEQKLDAYIPDQNVGLDGGISEHNNTNDICIKKMSYDPEYPTVMVPVEFGASTYECYGDYYYYKSAEKEKEYYLCTGDPMNAKRGGGLFEMRAIIDSDDFARYYCGGRLMFR